MKHDAIVKQGTNRDKIVYSQLSNIKEKRGDAEKLQAPTADEEALTAERTRQAFEKVSPLVFFICVCVYRGRAPPICSLTSYSEREVCVDGIMLHQVSRQTSVRFGESERERN